MAAPSKPTNLKANISLTKAKLSWTAPAETVTDYEVRYQQGDTAGGAWTSLGSTNTTYTVTGLATGAQYTFQVRAVNSDGESDASNTVIDEQHRRGQITDAFTALFQPLKDDPADSECPYPIQIKTIRKRFASPTQLDKQNALPAILITSADGGSAPDAPSVGYTDERFPIGLYVVLKETDDKNLIDQYSDAHYSIDKLIKATRRLGLEGVQDTRIIDWRSSEESYIGYLLVKFRVRVIHRYRETESV